MKYQCRIVSQQFRAQEWDDFQLDDILYSPRVPLERTNALSHYMIQARNCSRPMARSFGSQLNPPGITLRRGNFPDLQGLDRLQKGPQRLPFVFRSLAWLAQKSKRVPLDG